MNLAGFMTQSSPVGEEAAVRGVWQNVRWSPNLATGEVFNVGVLFRATGGAVFTRFIDDFDRMKCLYDESFAAEAKFLVEVAEDALLSGRSLPASNIYLSEEKIAHGTAAHTLLNELFDVTVPLGRPHHGKEREFRDRSIDANTGRVKELVLDELRRIAELRADSIIVSESVVQIRSAGRIIQLPHIHLKAERAMGSIVSARYAKLDTSELHVRRSGEQLAVAKQTYPGDSLFMYVLRRPTHTDQRAAEEADERFDELVGIHEAMGVQMRVTTTEQAAAQDIVSDMMIS